MNASPAHTRKVLYAMSEAQRDSLDSLEIAAFRNQPGVEIFVIDGSSSIGSNVANGILERHTVRPGDILIQNPYARDSYLLEGDVEAELAIEKASRVAHIAHLLGSTSARVTQANSDVSEDESHAQGTVGAKGVVGKLKRDKRLKTALDRQTALTDTSSGGEADIEAARRYIEAQNLTHDTVLVSLVDARAVSTNTLTKRVLTVDATREARASLEIAADISALKIGQLGGSGDRSQRSFGRVNVEYEITF